MASPQVDRPLMLQAFEDLYHNLALNLGIPSLLGISVFLSCLLWAIVWTHDGPGEQPRWYGHLIEEGPFGILSQWRKSSVYIYESDPLYEQMLRYMAHRWPPTHDSRVAVASTRLSAGLRRNGEEDTIQVYADVQDPLQRDPNQTIPFLSVADSVPLEVRSFNSSARVYHEDRSITITHCQQKSRGADIKQGAGYIIVSCYGRSIDPVWSLLEDVQKHALEVGRAWTLVYRAGDMPHASNPGWRKVKRRSQDIRNVIMSRHAKSEIFNDMNRFLSPSGMDWYTDRGVPYRRHYLFSGPPGTGKTTLALALAAVFGLKVFTLSLRDPALTVARFRSLMSSVPRRCIVLLEDVEEVLGKRLAADRSRSREPVTKPVKEVPARKTRAQTSKAQSDKEQSDKAGAAGTDSERPRARRGRPVDIRGSAISPRDFHDVIHGVASHDGYILIMTTRYPKKIDPVLENSIRVHRSVHFKLASPGELKAMFVNIFRDHDEPSTRTRPPSGPRRKGKVEDLYNIEAGPELSAWGTKFMTEAPAGEVSLGDVQDFLKTYKGNPRRACEQTGAWSKYILGLKAGNGRDRSVSRRRKKVGKQQPAEEGDEDGDEDFEADEVDDGDGGGNEEGDEEGDEDE